MTGTLSPEIPSKGDPRGTSDSKVRKALITVRDGVNALLTPDNKVAATALEAAARPVTWYTAKEIPGEDTRESGSFGTFSTADQIPSVVVPAGALLAVGYSALFKSSVGQAGRAAIFIGNNQVKQAGKEGGPVPQEATNLTNGAVGNRWAYLSTAQQGLWSFAENSDVSLGGINTGLIVGGSSIDRQGGLTYVGRVAAGTYTVSVRYRATSGNVTAKERVLWVAVFGAA